MSRTSATRSTAPSDPQVKSKLFYGWVIVGALLVVGTALWGIRFSFGVFFKAIEAEFGLSRAATSAILSLHMILGSGVAAFGGFALDRYGPKRVLLVMGLFTGLSLVLTSRTNSLWQLFFTYSLLLTIGTAALIVVVVPPVSRWFHRRRGLAIGIAGSGAGLGTVVMAPLATFLISNYDWRTAYLIMGIMAWVIVIPLALLLKRDPAEIGALPDGASIANGSQKERNKASTLQSVGLSFRESLHTRSFWMIISVWILFSSTQLLVLTHLIPHLTDIGISAGEAAAVLSVIGITNIAARVVMGNVSDRIGKKVTAIGSCVVQGFVMLSLIWLKSPWMFYIFAVVYGLAYGGFAPSSMALASETFGLRRIGAILGVLEIGYGIGAALGPAVGGLAFDATHSYVLAFIYGTFALFLSVLLLSLVRREVEIRKPGIKL